MSDKRADTLVPIHDLLERRWSGRAFDPDKPVKRAQLLALLEAARWAPSCGGEEPWRYLVWDRFGNEFGWQRAFECLSPANQLWAVAAPVLILSMAVLRSTRSGKTDPWAQFDTGAASENLCLQAVALGLRALQMGDFDSERVRRGFAVPRGHQPMTIIAVGYPGLAQNLDTALRERELGKRSRGPIGDRFFENRWGEPVRL